MVCKPKLVSYSDLFAYFLGTITLAICRLHLGIRHDFSSSDLDIRKNILDLLAMFTR